MNVLIKSATIVAPGNTSLHLKKRDIQIKNGKIETIGARISGEDGIRTIELGNLHVSLGWFDSGIAFGEPGYEERETLSHGLAVAAKSGFTDVVLNTNTHPSPDTSSDIVFLKERSAKKATTLHPLGNVTVKGKGETLAEMYDMHKAGAVAFYDFKAPLVNANLMKIALLYAQNFNGLVISYPLNREIQGKGVANEGVVSTRLGLKGIPALAEELQIIRDLYILEYTGGKLHIPTISSEGSIKLIQEAKKKGLDVTCSVALHNLILTDSCLEQFDTNYKVMPPLRTQKDAKALQKALLKGSIDFVTTDHTPMDIEQKRVEFDNADHGTIGLESAFGLLNSIFGMEDTIAILTRGRDRFGLAHPELEKNAMANLTLFNPSGKSTFEANQILSTSKNSAFIGQSITGKVYGVINNGKVTLR